jgi:glycosyltransferase involved in cell wall biosynthesis
MSKTMPLGTLALCIPAHNAAAFLPRLLGSAAHQHIPFDEVLVYDDCSTDNTGDVARSLGATVIRGDQNLGCSSGKNRLLELTRCEWVHFHDADDDMNPGFTTLAHKWMARSDAPEVVLFNYESRSFETGQVLAQRQFDGAALRLAPQKYAIRTQINPYCGLYKVEALRRAGGYDEDPAVLYNEDCRFHMRLAFAGLRFDLEPEVEIINLERTNSMSSTNRARCAISRLAVLQKASMEGGPELRREIGLDAWLNARHLGSYGRFKEMADAIQLALLMGVEAPVEEKSRLVRFLARWLPQFTFSARARYVKLRDIANRPSR